MSAKAVKNIGISELRKELSKYFKKAKNEPVVVNVDRGTDARVILDSDRYNELLEAYEDYRDSMELTQLIKTDNEERVSWPEAKKKLGI